MLVYRRLLTKRLHGKAAVLQQITFEKGYSHKYLEVHAVMKHTQKHLVSTALLIISRVQAR